MPPVRCGSSAANSPMHRHTIMPMTTTSAMTKAPHQFVPRCREVATSPGGPGTKVSGSLTGCLLACGRCSGALVLGWSLPPSDGAQVAVDLPGGDFCVRRARLGSLGGHEVV